MKIAVVNYDELNDRPSNSQVINDICRLFRNSTTECKEDMGKTLSNQLILLSSASSDECIQKECDIFFVNTSDPKHRGHLKEFVDNFAPDLLVSYNLAGFELSTLADSLLYNLLNCRQFHIIKKKHLPNEDRLNILRSFNLFLFTDYKD